MSVIPVIIAGGLGTRLWPLSSKNKPKPFIEIFEKRSLFQKTLERVKPFSTEHAPLIVTNALFESVCTKQAQAVFPEGVQHIIEPCLKNTAPAITSAAHYLTASGEDPMMLILPADHIISPFDAFIDSVEQAKKLAQKGYIVTFGIQPTSAKTCYGYIKKGQKLDGGFSIEAFKEKPCKEVAQEYVESKQYFWNSGMFVAKASVILSQMSKYDPDTLGFVQAAVEKGEYQANRLILHPESYQKIDSDSIDYALMEKTELGALVPSDMSWSDIGTWDAYWGYQTKDKHENVLEGNVRAVESKKCLLISKNVEVIGFGVENIVAIATDDKIMITTQDKASELKKILKKDSELVEH